MAGNSVGVAIYITPRVLSDYEARNVFPEFRAEKAVSKSGASYQFTAASVATIKQMLDDARARCPSAPRGLSIAYGHYAKRLRQQLASAGREQRLLSEVAAANVQAMALHKVFSLNINPNRDQLEEWQDAIQAHGALLTSAWASIVSKRRADGTLKMRRSAKLFRAIDDLECARAGVARLLAQMRAATGWRNADNDEPLPPRQEDDDEDDD